MYSIKVEPPDAHFPVIKRKMCANKSIELIPVIVAICETEFHWLNAVALYMGEGVYRIFDLDHPKQYAQVTLLEDLS